MSDGQADVRALNSNIVTSKIVWERLDKLNQLGKSNKITLKGNEITNNLSKKREGEGEGQNTFCAARIS